MKAFERILFGTFFSIGIYILLTIPHISLFMFGIGMKYPDFLLFVLIPIFSIIIGHFVFNYLYNYKHEN